MLTYIQAIPLHIHTQGKFKNHTARSLYRIMVTVIRVVGVMKVGNTVPRAGLKPTPLAFRASVLPFHQVGSLMGAGTTECIARNNSIITIHKHKQ